MTQGTMPINRKIFQLKIIIYLSNFFTDFMLHITVTYYAHITTVNTIRSKLV